MGDSLPDIAWRQWGLFELVRILPNTGLDPMFLGATQTCSCRLGVLVINVVRVTTFTASGPPCVHYLRADCSILLGKMCRIGSGLQDRIGWR